MLSKEEAKARLDAVRIPDRRSVVEREVEKLAREPRLIGQAFTANWNRLYGSPRSPGGPVGPRIDALDASDRRRLFDALFPRMGADVERAWFELTKYPYQSGALRKGFRAKSVRNLTSGARTVWLASLCSATNDFEADAEWLAVWAGHMAGWSHSDSVGKLLATVIDAGGDKGEKVLQILLDTAAGRHDIGTFGRFLTRALSCCSRREAWECVEGMLLAAQREEGLRQAILETIDEAHPEAFRRIVALVAEHGLARFASVARAVDVWFGMSWDSAAASHVDSIARRFQLYGTDEAARRAAIASDVAEDVYLALFCTALEDAVGVVDVAQPLLKHPSAEVRYAAVYLLVLLRHSRASSALYDALDDADLRVVDRAIDNYRSDPACWPPRPDLFERLEAQLPRWPAKKKKLEPILWPWCVHELDRLDIGHVLLQTLEERPFSAMLPHVAILSANDRADLCKRIEKRDGAARKDGRALLVEMLGDASPDVRKKALEAFTREGLEDGEERSLEELFTRKPSDLRRALVDQLLKLPDERLQASIERLLEAKKELQRAGGLEILRRCIELGRMETWCRGRAGSHKSSAEGAGAVESARLAVIENALPEAVTLEDALGLSPVAERTPLPPLKKRDVELFTAATEALLRGLDAFVTEHAQEVVTSRHPYLSQAEDVPFANVHRWRKPWKTDSKRDEMRAEVPLRESVERFWRERPPQMRDDDGFERLRAALFAELKSWPPTGRLARLKALVTPAKTTPLAHAAVVGLLLDWSNYLDDTPGAPAFLLDALEGCLASMEAGDWETFEHINLRSATARSLLADSLVTLTLAHRRDWKEAWNEADRGRLWNLARRFEASYRSGSLLLGLWFDALEIGAARDADLVAALLQPPIDRSKNIYRRQPGLSELAQLTQRRKIDGRDVPPRVTALMDRVRTRIVELELARGEHPQPGSEACSMLAWTGGLEVLARASRALSGSSLRRGTSGFYSRKAGDRERSISQLLQRTRPGDDDTFDRFAQSLPANEVGEERLLEIAMFAPQWCAHVEHALGRPGLAEAVWWMHAHTKDESWRIEQELRELWAAQTAERTPLTSADLIDGAVDVEWFNRIRATLGSERFGELLDVAKFASTGTGHTRAKLFASALLGKEDVAALATRVREKRHQDTVRALGLVPLPEGAARKQAVLDRYLLIQEFVAGSKKFGSQRQASEKRAAAIALENLARTAGYPDPVRLEWAMEREALSDLIRGSVKATAGEVEVTLSLDDEGEAQLVAHKAGKALKSIPAAAKKAPDIKALVERERAIGKQKKRMRTSLEQAMVRGDAFTGAELVDLLGHPILAPLLQRLVLVGTDLCGYPRENGRVLLGHDGTTVLVAADAKLRIAHAHDLLGTGQWSQWQRDCLRREVVQPFKQVFRELYVLTDAERADPLGSRRYAGHQVHARQAMALLGSRGWIWTPEEGARKVDHATGLATSIGFLDAPHSPAEIDGLTIEAVIFTRRGEWKPLALDTIPPRLFSETMRDMDLVVSVANRAGVDPEASTSSIEARAALVRETCALLGIENVRIDGRFAFIQGKIAAYSVHLGSAVVHMQPGGHLCIVPVHAQARGRMFLPFADDDPKTAGVLSKVLLLARDDKIKDPSILEQIRR